MDRSSKLEHVDPLKPSHAFRVHLFIFKQNFVSGVGQGFLPTVQAEGGEALLTSVFSKYADEENSRMSRSGFKRLMADSALATTHICTSFKDRAYHELADLLEAGHLFDEFSDLGYMDFSQFYCALVRMAKLVSGELYENDMIASFNEFLETMVGGLYLWGPVRSRRDSRDPVLHDPRIPLLVRAYMPNLWRLFLFYAVNAVDGASPVGEFPFPAAAQESECALSSFSNVGVGRANGWATFMHWEVLERQAVAQATPAEELDADSASPSLLSQTTTQGGGFCVVLEALTRIATVGLRRPPYRDMYKSPYERVAALMTVWGVADPHKLEGIRRLNSSKPLQFSTPLGDAPSTGVQHQRPPPGEPRRAHSHRIRGFVVTELAFTRLIEELDLTPSLVSRKQAIRIFRRASASGDVPVPSASSPPAPPPSVVPKGHLSSLGSSASSSSNSPPSAAQEGASSGSQEPHNSTSIGPATVEATDPVQDERQGADRGARDVPRDKEAGAPCAEQSSGTTSAAAVGEAASGGISESSELKSSRSDTRRDSVMVSSRLLQLQAEAEQRRRNMPKRTRDGAWNERSRIVESLSMATADIINLSKIASSCRSSFGSLVRKTEEDIRRRHVESHGPDKPLLDEDFDDEVVDALNDHAHNKFLEWRDGAAGGKQAKDAQPDQGLDTVDRKGTLVVPPGAEVKMPHVILNLLRDPCDLPRKSTPDAYQDEMLRLQPRKVSARMVVRGLPASLVDRSVKFWLESALSKGAQVAPKAVRCHSFVDLPELSSPAAQLALPITGAHGASLTAAQKRVAVEFSITATPGQPVAQLLRCVQGAEMPTKVLRELANPEAPRILKRILQVSVLDESISLSGPRHIAVTTSWELPPGGQGSGDCAVVGSAALCYDKIFQLQGVVDMEHRDVSLALKHYHTHAHEDRHQVRSSHELFAVDLDALPHATRFVFFVISSDTGLQQLVAPSLELHCLGSPASDPLARINLYNTHLYEGFRPGTRGAPQSIVMAMLVRAGDGWRFEVLGLRSAGSVEQQVELKRTLAEALRVRTLATSNTPNKLGLSRSFHAPYRETKSLRQAARQAAEKHEMDDRSKGANGQRKKAQSSSTKSQTSLSRGSSLAMRSSTR